MSITIRCACGQEQFVAEELAGTTHACVMCDLPIDVPKAAAAPSNSFGPMIAIGVGLMVIVVMSVGAIAWWHDRDKLQHAEARVSEKASEPRAKEFDLLPAKSQSPLRSEPSSESSRIPLPTSKNGETQWVIKSVEPAKKSIDLAKPIDLRKTIPEAPITEPMRPVNVMEPLRLVWKLRTGEVFFQELVVTQRPTFQVQGLPIAMLVQYRIVSRFTVTKENKDGSLGVEQKIERAKLLQADDLSKPSITGAITRLPGRVNMLELSSKMDVTKFDALPDRVQVNPLEFAGGLGFQTATLIDRDGWKELIQATFFQFDQPMKPGLRWAKPMTHNWGGLGSWHGQIQYRYIGKEKDLHRVAYSLQLAYKMPMVGGIGTLKVNGANFQPQQAEGVILFDAVRGRVIATEERFRVRGVVNANVLGQNSLIGIDEDQHFAIRIHDKMPP